MGYRAPLVRSAIRESRVARTADSQDVANHGSTVMSARSFAPVLEPKMQAFVDSLDAARGPLLRRSERVRGTGDFVKLRMPSGDSA